ncbi:MAG: hypothetical protein M3R15_24570 [Acidobacteriota bacterium]|nr:hypothetical protein [Acidobacteriota bacterium]
MSSLEETRRQINVRTSAIKLGIDVHQAFYVVVMQEGGSIQEKRSGVHEGARQVGGGDGSANVEGQGAGKDNDRRPALALNVHTGRTCGTYTPPNYEYLF